MIGKIKIPQFGVDGIEQLFSFREATDGQHCLLSECNDHIAQLAAIQQEADVCFYPGPHSVEKGAVVRLIVAFTSNGETFFIELLRSWVITMEGTNTDPPP